MKAVKLDIGWNEEKAASVSLGVARGIGRPLTRPNDRLLSRSITPAARECRCPECNSIVYSRRNRLCGVCGESLPAELLFSPDEARRIHEEQIESDRRSGTLGAELIEPGATVLTHCNTGSLATGGIGTSTAEASDVV